MLLSQPLSCSHSIRYCSDSSQYIPEDHIFNLIITEGFEQVYSSSNNYSLSLSDELDESTTREQGTAAPHPVDTVTIGLSVAGSLLMLVIIVVIVSTARKL